MKEEYLGRRREEQYAKQRECMYKGLEMRKKVVNLRR